MNPKPPAKTYPGSAFKCFTDREGRMIGFQILGAGSPTVILDAGFQNGPATWGQVASKIASFATVLVLDRSRLLRSASHSIAVDAVPVARQIRQLLDCAHLHEPIVPVGWAIGSLFARAFTGSNPSDVVGLVLIDHVPEQFLREVLDSTHAGTTSAYCLSVLVDIDQLVALYGRDALEFPAPLAPLEIPVTHISRGSYPPPEDVVAQRWIRLQQEVLREMTQLREIIAGRSGHAIPIDRPEVIVDAVRDLVLPTT